MLKKDITYTNPFTDEEVTEEHYFHISKADMVEMELEEHNLAYKAKDGQNYTGMQAKLMKIIDSEDGKAIIAELKDIIRRSYCKRVGDRPVKNQEIWEEFSSSEAFSQLLFELCTDAELAGRFMNGVIPKNLAAEAASIATMQSGDISANPDEATDGGSPALKAVEDLADRTGADFPKTDPPQPRVLTEQDMREMDVGELQSGLAAGRYTLS